MRTTGVVVFTGISLSHAQAGTLLPAVIRPPVKRGDLDALSGASSVAIIDGELHVDTILQPNEILRAIARGVHVRGSSSVGAFRAAELHARGMAGIGWVYDAFRTHRISGLDEIAVIYDPRSCRPLTIPLVNVRYFLDRMVESSLAGADEALTAMTALKSLRLEQRDPRTVLVHLARILGKQRFKAGLNVLAEEDMDIKAQDARELLRTWFNGGIHATPEASK
jgi:hypothetical protein